MSEFINTIDLLGEEVVFESIIDGSITEFNDNVVTNFGAAAMQKCEKLVSVDLPSLTNIGNGGFYYCSKLTAVNFPLLTSVGDSALEQCTSLTTVDFPLLTSVGTKAFRYCSKLTAVNFPLLTSVGTTVFEYCGKLTTVDFPLLTSIGSGAFKSCSVLTTLILRSSTLCTLSNTNAFTSTPIASGTGYIYVPRALVDSYKSATNWSTYASQFRALEDYTVDGTTTGALDETKI